MEKSLIFPFRIMSLLLAGVFVSGIALAQETGNTIVVHPTALFNGDTVAVEYSYASRRVAPFVCILPDRYGVQVSTHQLMKALNDAGYHTVTMPLLTEAVHGDTTTEIALNETDIDRIIQVMVDVRNDPRCKEKIGLLGFDVGAQLGAAAQNRIPLFAAMALFYPPSRQDLIDVLKRCTIPVEVNTGKNDPVFPESGIMDFKLMFGSKTNRMIFRYYEGVSRMFFNPGHPDFDAGAMQRGLDHSASMFRTALR